MKKIEILHINSIDKESPLAKISAELNKLHKNVIGETPWKDFAYKPDVTFTIAYNDCLFIKYYVVEKSIRAEFSKTNEPVYKDSCVEFFISFDGDAGYYNMEFNCIGTCLIGFGSGRSARNSLPEKLINNIKYQACINSSNDVERTKTNWELTLMIPLEVFAYHKIDCLRDKLCRANFYKCGDSMEEPHFLTWNNIIAESPDFHLPQFFGEIVFI